jgi:hypothetical protein
MTTRNGYEVKGAFGEPSWPVLLVEKVWEEGFSSTWGSAMPGAKPDGAEVPRLGGMAQNKRGS